jgi:hypothetical protein
VNKEKLNDLKRRIKRRAPEIIATTAASAAAVTAYILYVNGVGGSTAICPWCNAKMRGDGELYGTERFECPNTDGVFFMVDGELVDAANYSSRSGGGSCEMCQASLASGERYLPYEDGSNSHAYIKCPSCKHENIRYGFGEDGD